MANEKWTKAKYEKFVKEIREDIESEEIGRGELYDIADSILCEPGLKEFMRKELKVTDVKGRLVGDIS